ncbi:FCD domain-containing protein [Streptomyces venezuelae]
MPLQAEREPEAGPRVRAGEHVADRPLGQDPSLPEAPWRGGAGGQLLQVVGHRDRGQGGMCGAEGVERVEQLLTAGQVETGGRFDEEEEPGLGHERAGDQGPAALALRQRGPAGGPPFAESEGLPAPLAPSSVQCFVTATRPAEDWPTRLRAAAVTDVYEVRMLVEVEAARLAARRRTDEDVAAMREALDGRRRAADGVDDAGFVDADIALHAAIVASARNPVLTDLFAEFAPVLRQGLIDLLDLLDLRGGDPRHGEESHAALVAAVESGTPEEAARLARTELESTLALLKDRGSELGAGA